MSQRLSGQRRRSYVGSRANVVALLLFALGLTAPQGVVARTLGPLVARVVEAAQWSGPSLTVGDAQTSLSIGEPNRGRLLQGVALESDDLLLVRSSTQGENFGTRETVEAVRRAVKQVAEQFPGGHRLVVGDLSRARGGRIRPHKSHQSGRDVDLGFYLRQSTQPTVFVPAGPGNLDLERSWALIEALHADEGVQYIFIDRRVQRLLYAYARDVRKVDAATLDQIFEYPQRKSLVSLVRHRRGHRNHLHVRYFSPEAVAAGERLGPQMLARLGESQPSNDRQRVVHRVKRGETLARIAHRHRVDLTDLMRWNGLKRRSTLQVGQGVVVWKAGRRVAARADAHGPVCHAGPFGAVGCWPPPRT